MRLEFVIYVQLFQVTVSSLGGNKKGQLELTRFKIMSVCVYNLFIIP